MGYYTRFQLEIISGDDYSVNHEKEIAKLADYTYLFDCQVKWYNCENDMREYSQRYPNIVFQITGEGEESDDIWRAYFKDGKMHRFKAKITFDDYDESKLQ